VAEGGEGGQAICFSEPAAGAFRARDAEEFAMAVAMEGRIGSEAPNRCFNFSYFKSICKYFLRAVNIRFFSCHFAPEAKQCGDLRKKSRTGRPRCGAVDGRETACPGKRPQHVRVI
jgi:hypothetical protein